MRTASIYDPATGLFTGGTFSTGDTAFEDALRLNVPEGFAAIEGQFDHLTQCVDVKTREVIDYQPPQPSPDHEWDDAAKRWTLSAEAQAAIEADQQALAVITLTEADTARAMREGLLELLPADSPARLKLQQADDAIAAERPKLKRG